MTPRERDDLLVRYLADSLDKSELKQLNALLIQDMKAAERLAHLSRLEYLLIQAGQQEALHRDAKSNRGGASQDDSKAQPSLTPIEIAEIEARADRELKRFLAEQAQSQNVQQASSPIRFDLQRVLSDVVERTQLTLHTTWKVSKRVGMAAVVLLIAMLSIQAYRMNRVVAYLGDQVYAAWLGIPDSNELRPGFMVLDKGYAQIHFRSGADVLLQAPCEFELLTPNRMHLHRGSVSATVPPQASGFRIDTDEGTVVDYGTEFGVGMGNRLDVHVFQGEIALKARATRKRSKVRQRLEAGQTVSVMAGQQPVLGDVAEQTALFVRELPDPNSMFGIPGKRIDLADIVGGGNGYGSGRPDSGIDFLTGEYVTSFIQLDRMGTPGFHQVTQLSFVDGVFLPDGATGDVKISTQGDIFQGCPATSRWYWAPISNTSLLVDPKYTNLPGGGLAMLGGLRYGIPKRPVLFMHANAGVTFDLESIRASISPGTISAFTAICGLSESHKTDLRSDVDVWVLVDGEPRFSRSRMVNGDSPVPIQIELQPVDRFLTLVTTDHDMDTRADVLLFGCPALEIER